MHLSFLGNFLNHNIFLHDKMNTRATLSGNGMYVYVQTEVAVQSFTIKGAQI